MDRALVVVSPVEGIEWLVAEAGRLAGGVGADLIVLSVTSDTEFEEQRKEFEAVMSDEAATYDVEQASAGAAEAAAEVADAALADVDVEYEAVGAVGEGSEQVLAVADEQGCDHVFMTGRRRSPTGKAIFGDLAQQVVLNFPGPVTIVTHPLDDL